jgi:two-component system, NarL family, nitrate/nitrite response regulator NarL
MTSPADTSMPSGDWIAVVHDDPRARERTVSALLTAGYPARGAGSAEEALYLVREEQPRLVITEVELPGQSGYELRRLLHERFGDRLPVLFVSALPTACDVTVGSTGDEVIERLFDPGEIVVRVRRALAASDVSFAPSAQTESQDLTPREREVLRLLAEGLSQTQIAGRLATGTPTVAAQIQRILEKLQSHSRAETDAWTYAPSSAPGTAEPALSAQVGAGGYEARDGSS